MFFARLAEVNNPDVQNAAQTAPVPCVFVHG